MNCQPSKIQSCKKVHTILGHQAILGHYSFSMSSKMSVDVLCMTSHKIYTIIQQKWVIQPANKDERKKKSQKKRRKKIVRCIFFF